MCLRLWLHVLEFHSQIDFSVIDHPTHANAVRDKTDTFEQWRNDAALMFRTLNYILFYWNFVTTRHLNKCRKFI